MWSKVPKKLSTATGIPKEDLLLVFKSWFALLAVHLLVSLTPFKWWRKYLLRATKHSPTQDGAPTARSALHIARLFRIATRNHVWSPNCLRRSLALYYILSRSGLRAKLRLGVKRENNELLGHAWIEYKGRVLNDAPESVAQYIIIEPNKFGDDHLTARWVG